MACGVRGAAGTREKDKSARRAPFGVRAWPGHGSARSVRPGPVGVGGRAILLVAAASVCGGRDRGPVRRAQARRAGGVSSRVPAFLSPRGLYAGCISVVVSELGRPLNDQAAATYFFGFGSSLYGVTSHTIPGYLLPVQLVNVPADLNEIDVLAAVILRVAIVLTLRLSKEAEATGKRG